MYLSLGMKLIKILKILKCKRSDWIKKYVESDTEKTKNAKHEFEKSLFKLMNDSTYGKAMENLRKKIIVRLVSNAWDLKYVSEPTFIFQKNFSQNFAAIYEIKPVWILNKPIYVGLTVPELSKYLMYGFHYNLIKKKFDTDLLFTDTDSLTYEIKPKDVYK